ncbi:MAG TPA: hypothetical protein VM186_15730 [Planctomycetota bacterium]|nr:hypothetical protein [Planctomycetota bacterium]
MKNLVASGAAAVMVLMLATTRARAGDALVCVGADPQKAPALAAGANDAGLAVSSGSLRDGVPAKP